MSKTSTKPYALYKWIIGFIVFSLVILKTDGLMRECLQQSLVPYIWIGIYAIFLCVMASKRAKTPAKKLIFAYLSALPLCLVVGEGFFYLKTYFKTNASNTVQPDEILGFANVPNLSLKVYWAVDHIPVHDLTYHNDSYGMRLTPHFNAESTKCINIYGDSFTYGYGLNDNQTLSAYLQKDLQEYSVRNFGISASGAHHMLARLEFGLDDGLLQGCKENIFIFETIPHHIYRALGVCRGPKYELDSSHIPRYKGIFSAEDEEAFWGNENKKPASLHQRFSYQLAKSFLFSFLANPVDNTSSKSMLAQPGMELGFTSGAVNPSLQVDENTLYLALLSRIQEIVKEKYNAKLYVLYWDYDMHAQFLDSYDFIVLDYLRKHHISHYRVSEALGEEYKKDLDRLKAGDFSHLQYRISRWDTHPNALANEKLATFLSEQIKKGRLIADKIPTHTKHKE